MPTTVNDFIAHLIKYRCQHPDNGSAEVMLQAEPDVAFEFHTAHEVAAMNEKNLDTEKFLVFVPSYKGKRLNLKMGVAM